MADTTIFKAKYENHTIIYTVKIKPTSVELELSIDDRFWDSSTIGLALHADKSDPRNADLQGTFVENGVDYSVLVRLKKTFVDLMDIAPTLYINNKEVPLIRTN